MLMLSVMIPMAATGVSVGQGSREMDTTVQVRYGGHASSNNWH